MAELSYTSTHGIRRVFTNKLTGTVFASEALTVEALVCIEGQMLVTFSFNKAHCLCAHVHACIKKKIVIAN